MSMTPFQREGLCLLGYSRKESEFLFLVATHSGYFTIRQFKFFLGTESGSVSHAFVRKLLAQKHATFRAYRSGGRVYHLFARKVYQAIERENLRTRKKHELEYVKNRLVALDFVLAHPEYHYLETEAEKLDFFAREYNLDRETLPVKLYRARKSADVTPRYFVDRSPMFVNAHSSPAFVTFTFVDAGAITTESFGTHLKAYLPLFRAVPMFELIYIAPTSRLFQAAESEFSHLIHGARLHSKSLRLLDYFRLRKAWDAKERVASADVVLLKEAHSRYCDNRIEELYKHWCSGRASTDELVHAERQHDVPVKALFRTAVWGSSLKLFSDPHGGDAEISQECPRSVQQGELSSKRSIEATGI
jgi:hypothetical protein